MVVEELEVVVGDGGNRVSDVEGGETVENRALRRDSGL